MVCLGGGNWLKNYAFYEINSWAFWCPQVPENQWYCQVCAENQPRVFNLDLEDMTRRIGAAIRRMSRTTRPNQPQPDVNQPSTSGHTTNGPGGSSSRAGTSRSAGPSSSRPEPTTSSSRSRWATTRPRTTTRRRRRRRTTRNVVVEYEIREGEKFPIKTKKKAVKRRRQKVCHIFYLHCFIQPWPFKQEHACSARQTLQAAFCYASWSF